MMHDSIPWQPLLRESLAVLALPADEQFRVNSPGCVSCDLFEDFMHARTVAIEHAPNLSFPQRQVLDELDRVFNSMQKADKVCFDDDAIRRPNWHRVRDLAAVALRMFGWEGTAVPPFVEIMPGVWRRAAMGDEPECDT